jgi:hypothetical protein
VDNQVLGSVVVAKGDPVPGVQSAAFLMADGPAVDSAGDVVFKAFITGTNSAAGISGTNNSGIWLYPAGSSGLLLARTGATAPGVSPDIFSGISDPILHPAGSIAYAGTLKGGDVSLEEDNSGGVWLSQNGTAGSLILRTGSTYGIYPNSGRAYFKLFPQFVTLQPSSLAFLTILYGSEVKRDSNLALCEVDGAASSGTVYTLARTGDVNNQLRTQTINAFGISASAKGQSRSVDPVAGYMVFSICERNHASEIELGIPGVSGSPSLQQIAKTLEPSGPAPSGAPHAEWSAFGTPTVNSSGKVAFHGTLTGQVGSAGITPVNNAGIWLATGTTNQLIARTGTSAPGAGGANFATLGDPVLNNQGVVAFLGSLAVGKAGVTKDSSTGIWASTSGTLGLVAQAGGLAPLSTGTATTTGTFAAFQQIVLPDNGGPIFQATLAGVKPSLSAGLWSVDGNGLLHLLVQVGDTFEVHGALKTVSSFSIFTVAPQVSGQSRSFDAASRNIVYLANFTDHTWAIVQEVAP